MKPERTRAFTIVELLIAAVAGVIVLLGAGIILWGGQTSWNLAWKRMNLQHDAAVALQTITTYTRPATGIELDADGRWVKINNGDQWVRFEWPQGSHDLQIQSKDQQARILVAGTVDQVIFTQQGRLLDIELALNKDTISTRLATAVVMRNSGT